MGSSNRQLNNAVPCRLTITVDIWQISRSSLDLTGFHPLPYPAPKTIDLLLLAGGLDSPEIIHGHGTGVRIELNMSLASGPNIDKIPATPTEMQQAMAITGSSMEPIACPQPNLLTPLTAMTSSTRT